MILTLMQKFERIEIEYLKRGDEKIMMIELELGDDMLDMLADKIAARLAEAGGKTTEEEPKKDDDDDLLGGATATVAVTIDDVLGAVTKRIATAKSKEEATKMKDKLKAALKKAVGVEKVGEVPADKYAEALAAVEKAVKL